MKLLHLFFLALMLISCQSAAEPDAESHDQTEAQNPETPEVDYSVALKFINAYAKAIFNGEVDPDIETWLDSRDDVTEGFKKELHSILENARKEDPEMGLGFDPLLDAQDLPSAFETEREDGEYLVVRGTDWPEFLLTLKLAFVDGKWRVDGCGIVNVPNSRQMKR